MIETERKTTQDIDSYTVLIADDDPPTRMLLKAAISQWGYEVIDAKDGEEAWDILQKPNPPQLLIVDWVMPKLDGIDLCKRIKAELPFHPYVILLTQMTGSTNVVKGLESGANEFLSKPFNMAELRSRLSVGARIVKYELILAEQSKQLDMLAEKRAKEIIRKTELIDLLNKSVQQYGGTLQVENKDNNVRYIIDVPKKIKGSS